MSCNNDNNICCPDTPYPTVQHESVPSLIDNLVDALYGEITKTVQGGRVVWDIPCDPASNPAEVPGIPRETGEGLLCYIMRCFIDFSTGGFNLTAPFLRWSFTGNGTTTTYILTTATGLLPNSYLVYIDGVVQDPINFTLSNNSPAPISIIFSTAIPNASVVTIISLGGAIPSTDASFDTVTPTGSALNKTLANWIAELLAGGGGGGGGESGFFNVADYGAVGDWNGTTGTDDSLAIQACINAAIAYTNSHVGEARVVFTSGSSYRLVTRQLNTIGQTTVSNHLNIYGGNTSAKLCIDGRGARLYGNGASPAAVDGSNGTDILYVCTRFDTIRIENLYFEQQPHIVIYGGAPSGGIRFNPFPTEVTYSKLFSIKGCQFQNCRMPFVLVPFNNSSYLNRLENLEILDTQMLHNRGSAHSMGSIGGNQTVNLSRYVKNFYCENVYFSGMPENNVLPFDVDSPVDGFSNVGGSHENYSNCFFTGNPIETIIPSGAFSVQNSMNLSPFVQPAINSTVAIAVQSNPFSNALSLNTVYIIDMGGPAPNGGAYNQNEVGPVGVYIAESFTGAFCGALGGTITFRRYALSAAEITPYAQDVAAGLTVNDLGYGIKIIEADLAAQRSLTVTGCRFIYEDSMLGYPYNVTGDAATNTFVANGPLGGICAISQASPAVVTKSNHGLLEGSRVYFTTTGTLPSGITASTVYIVRDVSQNTFTLSPIGSLGTRVTTTTAGSGVHTVNTAALIANPQKVRFAVSGGNLVAGKTYYVINASNSTFQVSETPNGSVFDLTSNVTAGTVQALWRGGDPCVAGYCPSTITGNVFYGYQTAIYVKDQFNWGPSRGSTITGNNFTTYSDEPNQTTSGFTTLQLNTNSCIFANNTITISKSKDTIYPLFVGGDNHVITGNTCICLNTANVPVPTRFINWDNGSPASGWRSIVENNVVIGLDHYGNAGSNPQVMGAFMGQLRGTIAAPGSQEIRVASRHIATDKNQWILRIEDDGEIAVTQYGGYAP